MTRKLPDNLGGRKIGKYKGHLFRSLYEYSFYKLLESRGINLKEEVTHEPVALPYVIRGKRRSYFPDFLVRSDRMLVEIKSTWELGKRRGKLIRAAKFAAARLFCEANGLTFRVMTEKDFVILTTKDAEADVDVRWIRNR